MSDTWYQKSWRPMTAYAYLLICIFDFVIMPATVQISQKTLNTELFQQLQSLQNSEVQIAIIQKTNMVNSWDPLTLRGSGLFHLSFGAIVTGAAITRGLQKKNQNSDN